MLVTCKRAYKRSFFYRQSGLVILACPNLGLVRDIHAVCKYYNPLMGLNPPDSAARDEEGDFACIRSEEESG